MTMKLTNKEHWALAQSLASYLEGKAHDGEEVPEHVTNGITCTINRLQSLTATKQDYRAAKFTYRTVYSAPERGTSDRISWVMAHDKLYSDELSNDYGPEADFEQELWGCYKPELPLVQCTLLIEKLSISEEVAKQQMTTSTHQYHASILENLPEIKGCPMGRDFWHAMSAENDLRRRVEMESKVRLVVIETIHREY